MHNAKLNNDKEFKVWGTGKPLREFLYVDDLSKAINHLIENNLNPELINIGSGDEITIKDLVNKISKIINYDGEIIFDDTKPDGNPRKLLDSSKVNSYGWDSEISLDQGLKLTYKWFNQNF